MVSRLEQLRRENKKLKSMAEVRMKKLKFAEEEKREIKKLKAENFRLRNQRKILVAEKVKRISSALGKTAVRTGKGAVTAVEKSKISRRIIQQFGDENVRRAVRKRTKTRKR